MSLTMGDPHGECAVEIHRLKTELAQAKAELSARASGEAVAKDWTDRYRVEQQGFWWWVIKCGTGERTLFKAHTQKACEEMAQELTTAFNDGLFTAPTAPGMCLPDGWLAVPREYTDEQLEDAITAVKELRQKLGEHLSDETLCGVIYDMMVTAAAKGRAAT